jgi:hypothetical protein
MSKRNGYELSRAWFDFAFENSDKVTSNHTALFIWLCEINNRLGWMENFQITAGECMAGMSCKSYNTYKKCLDNLIEWGFVKLVRKSYNQYQCNVIALSNFDNSLYKALDKALMKHSTKQSESTIQSTDDIHKQQTINHKPQTITSEGEPPAYSDIDQSQMPASEKEKRKVAPKEKEPSDDGKRFTDWVIQKIHPVPVKMETIPKIAPMYDKFIRAGYKKDDIKSAVEFATSDIFWREQFLSPMKLDKVNKDKEKFIDIFIAKSKLQHSTKQQPKLDNSSIAHLKTYT